MPALPAPALLPGAPRPGSHRLGPLAAALAGHGLLLWGLTSLVAPAAIPTSPATPLQVRWLDAPTAAPTAEPVPPPTRPQPAQAVARPTPAPTPAPAPPEAAAPRVPPPAAPPAAAEAEAVAAPSAPPAPPAAATPPAAPVVTAARFDADYLQNPAPPYPSLSRKLGEQGRVLLRAHVQSDGRAATVEIRQSSGSPRLDAAALDTVRRWRFVPARQGEQTVASWVLIPISFRLES